MLLFSSPPLIGLDVGSSLIKVVRLRQRGELVVAEQVGLAATPGGAFSDGVLLDMLAVSDSIRKLCRQQRLAGARVALAMSGDDVVIARLKLPRADGAPLHARLSEEAARLLPFPRDQASLDFHLVDGGPDAAWVEALLVAARREKVEHLVELLRRAGKTPAVVDAAACALANALEFNHRPAPSDISVLLHMGAGSVMACVLRGSIPVLARELPVGRQRFWEPEWSLGDRMALQLERVLDRMDEVADEQPLEPRSTQVGRLWLSGGGARLPGLADLLRERFNLPVEELNPFSKITLRADEQLAQLVRDHSFRLGVAVGLALRGLEAS